MKKTYIKPSCQAIEMNNEDSVMLTASGGMKMDQNVKVDQLSNKKDMWGNESIWDN